MILDAAELEVGAVLRADICIVGGGAAGITLALQFAGTRLSVVLLESGGLTAEPATQALARGELAPGTRHAPPHRFRRRQLGGATALWGGRCVPFDPIDFAERTWLPGPGWPIAHGAVAEHYAAANALCEAGDFDYAAAADWPDILAGFNGRHFSSATIERFSCPTDFGTRYRGRLAEASNLRIVLHANATLIETADDGATVTAIAARTLSGRHFSVRARVFILAAGGLEIPRLLLASVHRHPAGIGNRHDQVGRHYMCHLAGTFGALRPGVPAYHGYYRAQDGVYCRRRFALSADAQRRLGIGNLVARLHHPAVGDPSHGSGALSALYFAAPFITPEYATRLAHGARAPANLLRHTANIATAPRATAGFLLHWLRHRTLATRKFPSIIVAPPSGAYALDVHAEQLPNPASRITLGHGRDALGLPPLRIDWRHLPADIDTVRLALRALSEDLAPIATLTYDEDAVEAHILRDGAYGGHHIGTARMSARPQDGVVDADCRVHGMDNLYVAGSAVFPTSGQANPTLTIVALALRLARHLESKAFFFENKQQKTFVH